MFNKVGNKQQSGLQYPANGKPNDDNFDGDDDENDDDDVCHGDDIDDDAIDDVKMMMATKD